MRPHSLAAAHATRALIALAFVVGANSALATQASDAALAERLRAVLEADSQLASHDADVRVGVAAGRIRLSGTVRFYSAKLRSERLVRAAAPHLPVDNTLGVAPLMPATDRDIERAIVTLGKLNRFQGTELTVSVTMGAVWVRGLFHDPHDVLFLTEQIAAIEGVRAIEIDALFPV